MELALQKDLAGLSVTPPVVLERRDSPAPPLRDEAAVRAKNEQKK